MIGAAVADVGGGGGSQREQDRGAHQKSGSEIFVPARSGPQIRASYPFHVKPPRLLVRWRRLHKIHLIESLPSISVRRSFIRVEFPDMRTVHRVAIESREEAFAGCPGTRTAF